jgi:hypothetical protein
MSPQSQRNWSSPSWFQDEFDYESVSDLPALENDTGDTDASMRTSATIGDSGTTCLWNPGLSLADETAVWVETTFEDDDPLSQLSVQVGHSESLNVDETVFPFTTDNGPFTTNADFAHFDDDAGEVTCLPDDELFPLNTYRMDTGDITLSGFPAANCFDIKANLSGPLNSTFNTSFDSISPQPIQSRGVLSHAVSSAEHTFLGSAFHITDVDVMPDADGHHTNYIRPQAITSSARRISSNTISSHADVSRASLQLRQMVFSLR